MSEASGNYDIRVGSFDENDGQARFSLVLNDFETRETQELATLTLDADLNGNVPNSRNAISPTVASGIHLTPGDTITVNGFEDGDEFARLDYLELVSVI